MPRLTQPGPRHTLFPGRHARERSSDRAVRPTHALDGMQQAVGNHAVEALLRDRGNTVPLGIRAPMEASFGRSFADVRLHTGAAVDAAAARLDANAFTVGEDIYVRSDAPGADTRAGRALLGEELAHVVQGVGTQSVERVTSPYEPLERDARRAGVAAATGHSARVPRHSHAGNEVARQNPFVLEEGAKGSSHDIERIAREAKGAAVEMDIKISDRSAAFEPLRRASEALRAAVPNLAEASFLVHTAILGFGEFLTDEEPGAQFALIAGKALTLAGVDTVDAALDQSFDTADSVLGLWEETLFQLQTMPNLIAAQRSGVETETGRAARSRN